MIIYFILNEIMHIEILKLCFDILFLESDILKNI